jgi:hypothetical protein
MSSTINSYGSVLLPMTTRRAPDSNRGSKIIHFELVLPQIIANQVTLWETGGRQAVDPREAAVMLWSSPVAQFLNGQIDAWLNVPGLKLLVPGLNALMTTSPTTWPNNQAGLRELVANQAPGSPNWNSLNRELKDRRTMELLNDLVLIFKFAAIGYNRPLRTVAELYRLVYTLTKSDNAPASREDIIAHLQAPLVTPRVLSTLPGPAGPRPPSSNPPPKPSSDTVGTLPEHVMESLNKELTRIESQNRANRVRNVLKGIGLNDDALTKVMMAFNNTENIPSSGEVADEKTLDSFSNLGSERLQSRLAYIKLFGSSILVDISEILARIKSQRQALAIRILETLPATIRQRLQTAGVAIEELSIWTQLIPAISPSPSYLEPIGRSDLLLVRETTTGYRRSEIAYIENILIGESRNRELTNSIFTRKELFESTTRETEETHDLQVTDRAELSREISKVMSEDLKAQGSVEITSRGPTQVVASASTSFGRSTEEAAKSAENYSRETIDRAIKRTMERVTQEARSIFEQEITEINKHGFTRDGNAEDHMTGVYQYLERVSHARIFWYGERDLYDILIPEPASLIWQLAATRKEIQISIEKPDEELFRSITLTNIADKREEIIRAFRVTDMPEKPKESLEISTSFPATGSGDEAKLANSKELQIPDGYEVTGAKFVASAEVEDEDSKPNGGVTIAGEVHLWEMTLNGNKGSDSHDFTFTPPLAGPTISVAMNADNFTSLVGTVTLQLGLTDAADKDWALKAYGRVSERYEQLRKEYEQTVIQANAVESSSGVNIPEGTSTYLKNIVRAELQRAAIDVMRNQPVNFDLIDDFNFANSDGTLGSHPVIDLNSLRTNGPEIQFLQQAFEWEHLAWILYPYFWGRRTEWNRTVVISHADPDFAAFLNSGAARVQIPVRPGFEDLVKHFMATREVYGGDGLPKMGDPGYVPFIKEQMTSLGAPGEEVPWPVDNPSQWDFVQPTSLVLVRPAQSQLPKWDPETGAEI